MYNTGDNLQVKVINVSSKDRKIGLSIKALVEDSGADAGAGAGTVKEYKKKQVAGPATIGDLLKEEMESRESSSKSEDEAEIEAAPAEEAEVAEETAPTEEAGVAEETAPLEEVEAAEEAAPAEEAEVEPADEVVAEDAEPETDKDKV